MKMVRRFTLNAIFAATLFFVPSELEANAFAQNVSFELRGATGGIHPDEFNRIFDPIDIDKLDRLTGVSLGVTKGLESHICLAFRLGYFKGSTGTGEVNISSIPPTYPIFSTEMTLTTETIPVSLGFDFRLNNKNTFLMVGLSGEVHFLIMTQKLEEQPLAGFVGDERSSTSTFPGFNSVLGLEWRASTVLVIGVGGGYRLTRTDVLLPGDATQKVPLDLTGGYGTLYLILQPWRPAQ